MPRQHARYQLIDVYGKVDGAVEKIESGIMRIEPSSRSTSEVIRETVFAEHPSATDYSISTLTKKEARSLLAESRRHEYVRDIIAVAIEMAMREEQTEPIERSK